MKYTKPDKLSLYFRRDRVNRLHEIRKAVVRILFDGVWSDETVGEYPLNECIFEITRILLNYYPNRESLPADEYEERRLECDDGIACRLSNYFMVKQIETTGKLSFEDDIERIRRAERVQIPALIAELGL